MKPSDIIWLSLCVSVATVLMSFGVAVSAIVLSSLFVGL